MLLVDDEKSSASFGFNDYKNIAELKVSVFVDAKELANHQHRITIKLYEYLREYIQNHAESKSI